MKHNNGKGHYKGKDSKSKANTSSTNTSSTNKKELKFSPLDPKAYGSQPSYTAVFEALITKIKTTFDKGGIDVQECLELEVIKEPVKPIKPVVLKTVPVPKPVKVKSEDGVDANDPNDVYDDDLESEED